MVPAAQDQPAYVLHRRPFRETSAIVELLSLDFGRIGGVIRGVKGGRRQQHNIEPFGQVAVTWRGRGQLVTVLRSEPVAPRRLTGEMLFAGLYLNELLVKTLSHQEPVAALFNCYGDTLAHMARGDDLEPALRRFEQRLLEELGYGLAFDIDIRSGLPIEGEKSYTVVDGEGFQEVAAAHPRDTETAEGGGSQAPSGERQLTLSGREIVAIGNGEFADMRVRKAAKRIFRRALETRLAGKPLTTRRLFAARSLDTASKERARAVRSP